MKEQPLKITAPVEKVLGALLNATPKPKRKVARKRSTKRKTK